MKEISVEWLPLEEWIIITSDYPVSLGANHNYISQLMCGFVGEGNKGWMRTQNLPEKWERKK